MLVPHLTEIKPLPEYKLGLYYETGEIKVFDVKPYIRGAWYTELKDEAYFNTIRLMPDKYHIEWPNGQDLSPDGLYNSSPIQQQDCVYSEEDILSDTMELRYGNSNV